MQPRNCQLTDINFSGYGGKLRTRKATAEDLPVLAQIHKKAFSRSHFTALLSNETLARYYGYFLNNGSEILLALGDADKVEVEQRVNEKILGFAVYGAGITERISQFKRDALQDIFWVSLRHPFISVHKFLFAVLAKFAARPPYPQADFLLLSIAVAERRRGVGRNMLRSMLDAASQRGSKIVGLYVNADNINAINVYFSAGFVLMNHQGGQFYMEKNLGK